MRQHPQKKKQRKKKNQWHRSLLIHYFQPCNYWPFLLHWKRCTNVKMQDIFWTWNLQSVAIEFSSKSGMNQEANVALCDFVLLDLLGTQLFFGVRGNLSFWIHMLCTEGHSHWVIGQPWLSKMGKDILVTWQLSTLVQLTSHIEMIFSREDTWKGETQL